MLKEQEPVHQCFFLFSLDDSAYGCTVLFISPTYTIFQYPQQIYHVNRIIGLTYDILTYVRECRMYIRQLL